MPAKAACGLPESELGFMSLEWAGPCWTSSSGSSVSVKALSRYFCAVFSAVCEIPCTNLRCMLGELLANSVAMAESKAHRWLGLFAV